MKNSKFRNIREFQPGAIFDKASLMGQFRCLIFCVACAFLMWHVDVVSYRVELALKAKGVGVNNF